MLKEFREKLKENGLTGFLVPHDDSYFNEELSPTDERLAFISGFTGSAGLALITMKQAVIFVDGRYIEQAKHQSDFKVVPLLSRTSFVDWIETQLEKNALIGYDPRFISVSQLKRWTELFAKKEALLLPIKENLVDEIWKNKPLQEVIQVFDMPEKYAGKTSKEKIKEFQKILQRNKELDAFALCQADVVSWLLNKRSNAVKYNPCYLDRLIIHKSKSPVSLTPKNVALLQGKTVGIDAYETPVFIKKMLEDQGCIVKDFRNPFMVLPAIKNATELQGIAKACLLDSVALCRFLALIEEKKTSEDEFSIVRFLDSFRRENALYQGASFAPISAVDANSALPHYQADVKSALPLSNGKIYLLDTGAQYFCGTTDMTRTVALIDNPSAEIKKRYTQVLKGHIALARAVFPQKTTGGQLDVLARQYLWADGLDFNHGTGHGIGCFLNVHETPPSISPNNREVLQEGMILSDEPGFYLEDCFGIRIENMIQVVASKQADFLMFEVLTFVPFCCELIEEKLLLQEEKNWISDYYAKIRKCVYPLVDEKTKSWLDRQLQQWMI